MRLFFLRAVRRKFAWNCAAAAALRAPIRYVHMTPEEEEDFLVRQLIQQTDDPVERIADAHAYDEMSAHDAQQQSTADDAAANEARNKASSEPAGFSFTAGVTTDTFDAVSSSSTGTQEELGSETGQTNVARQFVSVRRSKGQELEWQCVGCSAYNLLPRKSCRKCGLQSTRSHLSQQATPTRHVVMFPATWYCNVGPCRQLNRSDAPASAKALLHPNPKNVNSARKRYFCDACHQPFQGVHDWICPLCATPNSKAAAQCCGCYNSRPVGWSCGHCGEDRNSIFSASCASCSKVKQPRNVAGSSTVVCDHCGAYNHSVWEVCSDCLSPLPAMVVRQAVVAVKPPNPSVRLRETSLGAPSHRSLPSEEQPPSSATADAPTSPQPPPLVIQKQTRMRSVDTWTCATCNTTLRMIVPFCDVCLTPRETSVVSARDQFVSEKLHDVAGAASHSQAERGRWNCHKCSASNSPVVIDCEGCQARRLIPSSHWQCDRCRSVNRASRIVCIGCAALQKLTVEVDVVSTQLGFWNCRQCMAANSGTQTACATCGTAKYLWSCSCGAYNSMADALCATCGEGRPRRTVTCLVCSASTMSDAPCVQCGTDVRLQQKWSCGDCGFTENDYTLSASCLKCGGSNAQAVDLSEIRLWFCDLCHCTQLFSTLKKETAPTVCPRCNVDVEPTALHTKVLPVSWICSCSTTAHSRYSACPKCRAPRRGEWGQLTLPCPKCCKTTTVNREETCAHCSASLVNTINGLFRPVILTDDENTQFPDINDQTLLDDAVDDTAARDTGAALTDDALPLSSDIDTRRSDSGNKPSPPLTNAVEWICALCGAENSHAASECQNCGMPKDL